MTYEYRCVNISCKERNELVLVDKPMREGGTTEYCKECKETLQKVYGSPAVKTGDGYKS